MPKFKYVARDSAGKRVAQTVDGTSKEDVLSSLKSQNLTVLSVTEEGGLSSGKPGSATAKVSLWDTLNGRGARAAPRVSGEMLVVFTRQFATMILSLIHI